VKRRKSKWARPASLTVTPTVTVVALSPHRLAALPYEQYLRSRHWRSLRARVLLRWNGRCENCGAARATEVHHRTYERLGRELLSDLRPLCSDCHELEHGA
jgi:5-methylcytosine-specific restriction endonuclease McrA